MAYDAGTAFLQIVPSFRDIEGSLKSGVRKMGQAMESAVADALPAGVARGAKRAEASAEKAGGSAGEAYGGAFIKKVQAAARNAQSQLPELKLRANPTELDQTLNRIRSRLKAIGDAEVDVKFDVTGAHAQLIKLRAELRALQRRASTRQELAFDADAAANALSAVDGMLDGIDRAGHKAWGNFSKGFNEAAKNARLDLPEVAVTDDVTKMLQQVRKELERHGKVKINLDVNEADALAGMRRTLDKLDKLAKDAPLRQIRDDAADAAKTLRTFLGDERKLEQAGEESAQVYGGAFAGELKKIMVETSAAIGEVNVDVHVDPAAAARLAALKTEIDALGKQVDLGLDSGPTVARLKQIQSEIDHIRRSAGDDIELQFDTEAASRSLNRVRDIGRKAGGALDAELKRIMTEASTAIGDVEVGVHVDPGAAAKLAVLKAEIDALGKQIDMGVDPRPVLARLEKIREEITRIRRAAGDDIELKFDTDAAGRALDRLREIGRKAAGSFADGFRQAAQSAQGRLPEFDVDVDSSKVEKAIQATRRELAELADKRIGIDISAEDALAELRKLQERLRALSRDPDLQVRLRVDTEGALGQIDKFFEDGGDGADKMSAKLRAAFESMPDSLEGSREALRGIADERIALNIDDAEVKRRVELIRLQLERLATYSPEIQIRIDAAAATAKLAAIREEADRTSRSVDNIGNQASGGIGRLAALVLAGASLGSILVPAAAAAAAAIGAIGTAAGAAVAGVGVVALGLFGITDAVQALNKAQQDQAKTAKSLGASNKALASSHDQVKTAELSLSNARADAADAAYSSEQRLQDARTTAAANNVDAARDLVDAQDAEKESRLALNDAIKEARQEMAELDLQVRRNSLNQRKATSEIAAEKAKRDAILANPRATAIEREQARIAYDERVLQLRELQSKGKELAKQQKDFARDGVEASTKVQSARKREVLSQRRVADAEAKIVKVRLAGVRSIADAQRAQARQQRDSARSIAAAQQQIVTAQRAAAQATVASAASGGAAMDNLRQAMAKLSPAGQRFAEFIFGLKDEFKGLTDAAQEGLLPGLQAGIGQLLQYLVPLQGFIGRVGTALGDMFLQFATNLEKPVWRQFFSYFNAVAVPTLQAMFTITENLAEGIANLFLAMAPFNGDITGGLVDATKAFALWAQRLATSHQYIDFLEYVNRVGPKVVDLIANIGEFIGRIVVAAAPIGEQVVDALNWLFDVLNGISVINWTAFLGWVAVIAGLGGVVSGLYGAFRKVYAIFFPLVTLFRSFATGIVTKYTPAVQAAALQTGKLSASQRLTATSTQALTTALNLSKLAWVGVGVAVGLLLIGLTTWYVRSKEQQARIDDMADSLNQLGRAFNDTGSTASQAVKDVVEQNDPLKQLIEDTGQLKISIDDVAAAAGGNVEAQSRVTAEYTKQIEALRKRDLAKQESKTPIVATGDQGLDLSKGLGFKSNTDDSEPEIDRDALIEQRDALKKNWLEMQRNEKVQKQLTESRRIDSEMLRIKSIPATAAQTAELEKNQAAIDKNTLYIKNHGTAQGRAVNLANLFRESLAAETVEVGKGAKAHTELLAARTALVDKQEDFSGGLLNLRAQVEGAAEAEDKHARSVAFNSKNLSDNSATALKNRDSIQQLAAQSRDAFLADIESGAGVDQARKAHEKRIGALKEEAKRLHLSKDAVNELIKSQGNIDPNITTAYETKGFKAAYLELQRLNFIQLMLGQGKSAAEADAEWTTYQRGLKNQAMESANQALFNKGKAAGGQIFGPGTGTSDSVPIWASRGEFMQRAAAVDYYGVDLMNALNRMAIPKDAFKFATGGLIGEAPGFAQGGGITKVPIVIDFSTMKIDKPTRDEAEQIVLDEMGGYQVSGGQVSGSLAVARAAENTARKMGATNKQLVALIEAGLVESGLRNLTYGDRDSIGFLQQRDSWGSRERRLDPAWATRQFINKAKRVDRPSYTAGELAQAVQVSAFPDRYAQREADAVAILNREAPYLAGGRAGSGTGGPGWRWQMNTLRQVFPDLPLWSGYRPGSRTLSGNESWHSRDGGRAVDVPPWRKVAQWIYSMYGKNTKELITPWRELNLWRGQPHRFSPSVEAQHGVGSAGNDHVHWAYDQGGWLPPGYRQVVNATGKPEAVFTAGQFQDIRSLAAATRASVVNQSTGGSTYQFDFKNSTLDQSRMTAMQQRADSLARVNRPNF